MTARLWLALVAVLLLVGCRDDRSINDTPHPHGGDWTKPGVFMVITILIWLIALTSRRASWRSPSPGVRTSEPYRGQ